MSSHIVTYRAGGCFLLADGLAISVLTARDIRATESIETNDLSFTNPNCHFKDCNLIYHLSFLSFVANMYLVESFPSHVAHWATLIFISIALNRTPACTTKL